eukprot:CAMPEP_0181234664 /NCGR_PEP_ID=MMETSP1096-20121128/37104_1 /TAXON_ID=156174 ORGANISM="Chrysochromulina ericina, Strain CCMP281" /NCGR_SAMPLE_ID=MMETSP1096 /ASSEMBLY_ACC=CAM_ASM_000453 /LENGTH=127 /DNA_ID=CAMNT_0023329475 /DNA_START=122 /DNA_END=506 /DNA_ORIENTATION=+
MCPPQTQIAGSQSSPHPDRCSVQQAHSLVGMPEVEAVGGKRLSRLLEDELVKSGAPDRGPAHTAVGALVAAALDANKVRAKGGLDRKWPGGWGLVEVGAVLTLVVHTRLVFDGVGERVGQARRHPRD